MEGLIQGETCKGCYLLLLTQRSHRSVYKENLLCIHSLFSHTRVLCAFCCTLRFKPQDSPRCVPFFVLWMTLRNLLFRDLELTNAQLMPLKHRFFLFRRPKVLLHNRTNLKILRPSSFRYFIFLLSFCVC